MNTGNGNKTERLVMTEVQVQKIPVVCCREFADNVKVVALLPPALSNFRGKDEICTNCTMKQGELKVLTLATRFFYWMSLLQMKCHDGPD